MKASQFKYSKAQRKEILDVLGRYKIELDEDICERCFLRKVENAARIALKNKERAEKELPRERKQAAAVRKEIRRELIEPVSQALAGFDGLSSETRRWLPSHWSRPYYEHLPDSSKDPLRRIKAELEETVASIDVGRRMAWADAFVEHLAMIWEEYTGIGAGLRVDATAVRRVKGGPFREFTLAAAKPAELEKSVSERRLKEILSYRASAKRQGILPRVRGFGPGFDHKMAPGVPFGKRR